MLLRDVRGEFSPIQGTRQNSLMFITSARGCSLVSTPGHNSPLWKQPAIASCVSPAQVLHGESFSMEGCAIVKGNFRLNLNSATRSQILKPTPREIIGRSRNGRIRAFVGECRVSTAGNRCTGETFFSSSIHRDKVGFLASSRRNTRGQSRAAKSGTVETEKSSSSTSGQNLGEDSSFESGKDESESTRQKIEAFTQRMFDGAKAQVIVAVHYVKNLDPEKVKHSLDVRRLKNVDVNKLVTTVEEKTAAVPMPPYTRKVVTWIGIIFVAGIVLDTFIYRLSRIGSKRKKGLVSGDGVGADSLLARTPSGLSMLLDKDSRRKESVEWVNMVIGKLWNLYRKRMETMALEVLQPVIDDLEKPGIVDKVVVESFFMGDEPITIRTVERRTSRRADDLQYHIGVRYTGGARLLLGVKLKLGPISGTIPVGVRGLDVDAEVWVKLRMLAGEPWLGTGTWAFVTLPKIKLALAPFRLVNLMDVPFLSMFLAKLLTEDLPSEFVRPNKNVIDFLEGQAVGESDDGMGMDVRRSFCGELSVTLVEASKVSYIPFLRTDPYCIFNLSEQVFRSKRNSQTSLLGPPGAPVWNQDFKVLVVDNKTEHLHVTLHDTLGFTSYPVGSADIDIKGLQDTVPVDRRLTLKSGWGPFPRRFAGEVIVRLTYKAYIDEEDGGVGGELTPKGDVASDTPTAVTQVQEMATFFKEEAGKVAELYEDKAAAKEALSKLKPISSPKDVAKSLSALGLEPDSSVVISSTNGSVTPSARSSSNGTAKVHSTSLATNGGARPGNSNGSNKSVQVERDVEGQLVVSNTDQKRPETANGSAKDEKTSARKILLWLTGATVLLWILAADFNLADLFN